VLFNGYHVIILDTAEFNAFASPGGHIFLTRGLVEAAPSEDALAGVIAHELAHILLKHSIKIIGDMKLNEEMTTMANRAADLVGRNSAAERVLLFRNSVSAMIDAMLKNGYAQPQEFEADNTAMALLAASGYDPGGLMEMLRVLQRVQGSQRGGFNSTHPSPEQRIANIETESGRFRVQDTRSRRAPRFTNK
jgi:predicted Zn-dependent protease